QSSGKSTDASADWVLPDIARMKDNHASREEAVKALEQFAVKPQGLSQIKLPVPEEKFRAQFRSMLGDIAADRLFAEELSVMYQTDDLLFRQALQVTMCASVIGAVRDYDPDELF